MTPDLSRKDWLATLVDEALARAGDEAARARLPRELPAMPGGEGLASAAQVLVARSLRHRRLAGDRPESQAAFLDTARGHVDLLLELAALAGDPSSPARRRARIAAALAAGVGEPDLALDADPSRPDPALPVSVDRAFEAAGRALRLRFLPPGDPVHGLPLYQGALAVLRHHLARVALEGWRSGGLEAEVLARHRAQAQRELVLLVEALAGLTAAAAPPAGPEAGPVRARQLLRLGLPRPEAREARRAMASPRPPRVLGAAAPPAVRPFLLEQVFLEQLRVRLDPERAAAWVSEFQAGAGLDAQVEAAARVEAAAQHDDHLAWFEAVGGIGGPGWEVVAAEWEATADLMVERVGGVVTHNLEALVTEIRETGELGQLLAKAASGRALTGEERRKVRAQLVDLAKAVPALAIFAAPGGMLLLPLLAKLLPFDLLPSAWGAGAKERPSAPAAPAALLPHPTGERGRGEGSDDDVLRSPLPSGREPRS